MRYRVELKKRAVKDLSRLDPANQRRVFAGVQALQEDLSGDVKRLTAFTPEYRLRIGDYRVLFEVVDDSVIVYRVKQRRDAYS
jgi:mRNA interferase RelE/StbE